MRSGIKFKIFAITEKNNLNCYIFLDNNSKPEKKEKSSSKNGESPENDDGEKKPEMSRRESTSAPETSDPVRIKCRELLCSALKTDGEYYNKFGH